MAVGSTQSLTEMITRSISWGKGGGCVRLTTLLPSCVVVMKSGNLNFLEPSGSLQACNGTSLPFTFYTDHDVRCFNLSPLKMMCRCCRFRLFRSCIGSFLLSYVVRFLLLVFFPTENVTVFLVCEMMPAYRNSIFCQMLNA